MGLISRVSSRTYRSQKSQNGHQNNILKENSVKIKMPLNKKQRSLCHEKRDNYLKCSKLLVQDFQNHKNFGKILKSCENEVGSMFGKCPSSWVDHFIRGDMNE